MAAGDVVRELLPALWLVVLPYVTGHGPFLANTVDYLEAALAPVAATVFVASYAVQGGHGMRRPLLRTFTVCIVHSVIGLMVVILALLALGAPLASHARGTFALGCFLTALLIPSLSVAAGTRWAAWHRCVLQLRFVDRVEQALVFPAVLAAAGAWVGALPLVLDWDSPWQQYPVPVAVGAVAGRALGGLALPWLPPPQRKQ